MSCLREKSHTSGRPLSVFFCPNPLIFPFLWICYFWHFLWQSLINVVFLCQISLADLNLSCVMLYTRTLLLFNGWISFHCQSGRGLLHPAISWSTLGVNSRVNILAPDLDGVILFIILGVYLEVEFLDQTGILCLTFEGLPNCFPKWLYHFTVPPWMWF